MSVVPQSTVSGIGHWLPRRCVTSTEIEETLGRGGAGLRVPPGLLARATGVESRQWRQPGEDASDLAAAAGMAALRHADVDPHDVDVLIFASASQDVAEPATANLVQQHLGCGRAACFDVKNACCSFLNGLQVAQALIGCGQAERVLVTAGEVVSPAVDLHVTSLAELERGLAGLTLGDGGGAMVVERADGTARGELLPGIFRSDGRHWRASAIIGGGSKGWGDRPVLECDGEALLHLAAHYLPEAVGAALDRAGWRPGDVDLVVPHQVSRAMVDTVAASLGFDPAQVVTTLAFTGNTAAASIPIALSVAVGEGRCPPGSRVLLVAGAGGFAVGCIPLVWGVP